MPRYEVIVLAARLLGGGGATAEPLLERLVAGELRPAFAGYEEATDFDLTHIETRIEEVDGVYRVTGRKILVIDGDEADTLLVVGRMGDDGTLAVVAVDRDGEGVSLSSYPLADMTAAADVDLVDAPATAPLLSGAGAEDILQDYLDEAIIMLCATMVGSLERSIERTREFLRLREQFGRPLAEFQALQHQVADLFIKTNDARSIVYRSISALHEGRTEHRRAAATCKVKVAATARVVTGQAVHLHGGIGFTTEYPIGHHYRRAFVDERMFGDSDFHFERFLGFATPTALDANVMPSS